LAELGFLTLLISIGLSAAAGSSGLVGIALKRQNLIKASLYFSFGTFLFISVSLLTLSYSLFTYDFQIRYVQAYSDREMSLFYLICALWAGQEGSLLLWIFLLCLLSVIAIRLISQKEPNLAGCTTCLLMFIFFYFAIGLAFYSDPFKRFLIEEPSEGRGLNPLLRNPYMAFHPPSLYLGFVGFTIPWALIFSGLILGKISDYLWVHIRRWALFSWVFLSAGNILGMVWAYEVLGWGGYWAWDPVENSSFLPWLTATASLHSLRDQKAKMKWAIFLLVLTFCLTILSTILTRSGILSSVHSFGYSKVSKHLFLFLVFIIIFSILVFVSRAKLKTKGISRSLLTLNYLFLVFMLSVLFSTLFPLISEVVVNERIVPEPSFYNRFAVLFGLAIIVLLGICKASTFTLKGLIFPGVVLIGTVAIFPYGVKSGFYLSLLVACGVIVFLRSLKRSKEVIHSPRLIFGAMAHLGILLMCIGFWGSGYKEERVKVLKPNEKIQIHDYELVYQGLVISDKGERKEAKAGFNLFKDKKYIGKVYAAEYVYRSYPRTRIGKVYINSSLKGDLYLILGSYDKETGMVSVKVRYNFLVIWIWIGGIVLCLGGVIALFQGRVFTKARWFRFIGSLRSYRRLILFILLFCLIFLGVFYGLRITYLALMFAALSGAIIFTGLGIKEIF
jgi:cytochrome c-type biogenesis protein CcmF